MTICEALDYVNRNLAVIGNAARLQDERAIKLVAAYCEWSDDKNIPAEELLINEVLLWQEERENGLK